MAWAGVFKIGGLAAAGAVVVAAGALTAYQVSLSSKMLSHVSIEGQPVGGLTLAQARSTAGQATADLSRQTITVSYQDQHWTASTADLGFAYDVDSAVQQAFTIGHNGGPLSGITAQVSLLRQPADVSIHLTSDDDRVAKWVAGVSAGIDQPVREADLRVAGRDVTIDSGQIGRSVDQGALRDSLNKAVTHMPVGTAAAGPALPIQPIALDVPVTLTQQVRTAAQLAPAAEKLKLALAPSPIRLQLDAKTWEIPSSAIDPLVSWNLPPAPAVDVTVGFNPASLRTYVDKLAPDVNRPSAEGQVSWGDKGMTVVKPSQDGRTLNVDATMAAIGASLLTKERTVPLAVKLQAPRLRTDDPAALGIKELVSEGTSNFSFSPYARVVNVRKMASMLNGVTVAPGEEFSFNAVMGDVGPGQGWATGLVIEDGRTVPGLGGGICQVSTTAFRAAFWAGLPITERHDHAYPVPYYTQGDYPEGFDATVWSPELDFKFKNDTPGFLLIQTSIDLDNYDLSVSFYGTKVANRSVKMDGPYISNIRPVPPARHITDKSKPKGYVEQTDYPHQGMSVLLRRVVTDQTGAHTDEFKSDYTPWSAVYVEGPKDEPAPSAGPAAPVASPAPVGL